MAKYSYTVTYPRVTTLLPENITLIPGRVLETDVNLDRFVKLGFLKKNAKTKTVEVTDEVKTSEEAPAPKKRGRPPKSKA